MQIVVEIILGMFCVGIVPVLLLSKNAKKTRLWKRIQDKEYFIYPLIMINAIFFFLFYQNTEILLGLMIGSFLFRLLAVGGVQRIAISGKKRFVKGQYLIFSVILVMILSADYLFKGKSVMNYINRIDGLLLIFMFLLYLFAIYGASRYREKGRCPDRKLPAEKEKDAERDNGKYDPKRLCMIYFVSEVSIFAGMYLLSKNVPLIGAAYGISQYTLGLTFMTWCVSISGVYISLTKKGTYDFMENIAEEIIVLITLGLGIVALIQIVPVGQATIYDLIIFSIILLFLQWEERISNRIAGSIMITAYIGFVLYVCIR